jgi:hypothetical protein
MLLIRTGDGSLYGQDGKVLHFSAQRFYDDVVVGGCCFVCGRAESPDVAFNDEHVVPQWILRRYKMYDQTISLPNGRSLMYGRYTVPCCEDCNRALGRVVEEPIKELLSGGIDAVEKRLTPGLGGLLFCWCALIFLKTDLNVKWNPDPRKGEHFSIGQTYDWQSLHHIQCMARLPVVGTQLGYGSVGTLMIREARSPKGGSYDYGDFSFAYSSMLQLDDLAIFAVMNDAKMCEQVLASDFRRLGRLSPLQTRELLAWTSRTNQRINPRPVFRTDVDDSGRRTVVAEVPEKFNLEPSDNAAFGTMVDFILKDMPLESGLREEVKKGTGSFVFKEDGAFIEHDFFEDSGGETPKS